MGFGDLSFGVWVPGRWPRQLWSDACTPRCAGTKEMAFVSAVTAAGLVHSVTRSCSAGNMTECSCDVTLRHGGSASEGWHWGGCSDDIHYGMSFSRKFLDAPLKNVTGRSGSGLVAMNLHNNEAGRQVGVIQVCHHLHWQNSISRGRWGLGCRYSWGRWQGQR